MMEIDKRVPYIDHLYHCASSTTLEIPVISSSIFRAFFAYDSTTVELKE